MISPLALIFFNLSCFIPLSLLKLVYIFYLIVYALHYMAITCETNYIFLSDFVVGTGDVPFVEEENPSSNIFSLPIFPLGGRRT